MLRCCILASFSFATVTQYLSFDMVYAGERLGRGIVTDAITTPVVNTSAYFFNKTSDLIDFKVYAC